FMSYYIWFQCRETAESKNTIFLSPDQIVSEQQSLVVIKKLLAIAVSGITYLRGIFPGKVLTSYFFLIDQQVMILREEHSCPGASKYWIAFLQYSMFNKYIVHTVYLDSYYIIWHVIFFQKVTEFYQFRIQYSAKGAQMEFESNNNIKVSSVSCGNTRKASILLVRKLYTLMQNLGPLPDNVCLNMKLAYYDDVTPQTYQPPGFREADGDTMEFEQEPVRLTVGEVVSPYHTLKFDMATERHRLEQVSQYEIPTTQETPSTTVPKKKRKFSEPKERY
uniref:HORMA domain containing 1 n=1 Tax=Amphilophus citrinellus TaxID=61819 RepID=A0A3Q0R6B6_AMPCI